MSERTQNLRYGMTGARLGIVAAVFVLVAVIAYVAFPRPSASEPSAVSPPPAAGNAAPTPAPTPTKAPIKRHKGPIESFEVFSAKDPFKPLVVEGSSGSSGARGGAAAPAPGAGTSGAAPGATNGATTTTFTPSSGGGKNVRGHRVKLLDVFTRKGGKRAQVQVDDTVYTVAEHRRFAEFFEVLSISGRCAGMLYGDDQFTICEGEQIIK